MTRWQAFLCGLGLHQWSKWETKAGQRRTTLYGRPVDNWHDSEVQVRVCATCGKKDIR